MHSDSLDITQCLASEIVFQLKSFTDNDFPDLFELISALFSELNSRMNFKIILNKDFFSLAKSPKCSNKYNNIL